MGWEDMEGDTWSKQCRRSPEVQKAVTSLVRSFFESANLLPLTPVITGDDVDTRYGDSRGADDGVLGLAERSTRAEADSRAGAVRDGLYGRDLSHVCPLSLFPSPLL